MIIDEFINISTNNRNCSRFLELGYKFNIGDKILVNYKDLSESCPVVVSVECDICKLIKTIRYVDYNRNVSNCGYYTCSRKCGDGKLRLTNLRKYGTEYPLQNELIKSKAKLTMINKYGVEYTQQSKELREKSNKTILEKYGDNYLEIFNNKIKKTKLEKYGDENYNNLEKSKETKLIRYDDVNYNNRDKYKKTNLERYGVEFPLQNDRIKKKIKDCFISKYGVDHPSMLEEFELKKQNTNLERYGVKHQMNLVDNVEKIKETKLNKYGDENYNNFEKSKETKLIKYGDENYNNHDKYVNTCIEKYGVDNNMKVPYLFIKNQKARYVIKLHEITKLYYQGSYELDFIEFCVEKNIKIKDGIVIDYVMNNKNRKYYSDFYIEEYNLICEIKSSYTYNINEEKNILKMKSSINSGYNFLFIVDKDYNDLEKIINTNGIDSTL